jgi:hypothetical protein
MLRMINMRKTSVTKRTGNNRIGRKLHNWEIHDLHSSLHIVGVIKPKKLRWVQYVARMGRREMHTDFD